MPLLHVYTIWCEPIVMKYRVSQKKTLFWSDGTWYDQVADYKAKITIYH